MNDLPPAEDFTANRPLIKLIRVRGLFDRFNYDLEIPAADDGGRLALLFGDNGAGKTTVLRAVWDLLSSADNRGHRSALANAPLRRIEVAFSDGSQVSMAKADSLIGDFAIEVKQPSGEFISAHYQVGPDGRVQSPTQGILRSTEHYYPDDYGALFPNRSRSTRALAEAELGQRQFISWLREHAIEPILLADDRAIYSDSVALERTREILMQRFRVEENAGWQPRNAADELRLTIFRASDLLRNLTLGGESQGGASANSIYLKVVQELAREERELFDRGDSPAANQAALVSLIEEIGTRSVRLEEYGLAAKFDAAGFKESLYNIQDPIRLGLVEKIVSPYFESMSARYAALEPAESLVRTLLRLMNDFLVGKHVQFDPRRGLRIVFDDDGSPIEPAQLSSGERQLTMLLCTTLLARQESRLFIIDEPELSLGVDWQRRIMGSLLQLTADTPVQFLAATHSIEITTAEYLSVVQLRQVSGDSTGVA